MILIASLIPLIDKVEDPSNLLEILKSSKTLFAKWVLLIWDIGVPIIRGAITGMGMLESGKD